MNKIYKLAIVLGVFAMFGIRGVEAQTNIATTATASAFTSDPNGLWNWSQINNNSFSTCGNQEAFIWTSTSGILGTEHMTWTWSSAKSMNKMRIHNAWNNTRNLTAADVYYYNGSTYVFWKTVSIAQACMDSVTFPTVTTTSLRLTNFKMTGIGQTSNPSWREIEIISAPSTNYDAGVSAITPLDFCTNSQAITARVFNFGKFKLDSFRLHWSVNGTPQGTRYVTGALASAKDTAITLNSSFSFTNNTLYTFKFWTSKPNGNTDSVAANDTLNYKVNFFGNPPTPTTTSFTQCGVGKPLLRATTGVNSDTIMWFTSATGGNPFANGKNVTGPTIKGTTTFYAQAYRFAAKSSLSNTNTGSIVVSFNYAAYNGNYFDVTPSSTLNIDSITFRVYLNNSTTNYRLYYKTGTFNGNETNANAWTLVNSGGGRCFTTGGQNFIKVSANSLMLTQGQLYGFYFTIDPTTGGGNDIYMKGSTAPTSNGDLYIVGGKYGYGLFGSTSFGPTYTIDCEFFYSKACINPTRTPLVVTVKPRPTGSDIVKGSPFLGQYRVGDNTKPDIAEVGKTITYNMVAPTGFTDAGHGSTWVINSIIGKTRNGAIVPNTEYTTTSPSSSGPGTIALTATSAFLDSFITFSIRYSDLGPHFCDSTVSRTVVVAPTPKPNFKFPASICLGDATLFENTTTIHSGNSTYMWYFDDGDSSDLQNPVHEYKAPGTYRVRLVATSFPWNVVKDTTITVEVGELPEVKFRANNKCQGLAVTFQNQTTVGNGALTYVWNFGDNTPTTTVTNPTHLYAVPGGYKVTLTASANGCVSKLVKNAYMFARPVANFSAPIAPICAKTEVSLPNTSTIALGEQGAFWNFGDGSNSTQFDGLHAFNGPGTYNVKLLAVSEFDCKDSITKQVTIKATPSPDFAGDQFCGKKPTVFTNTTNEVIPNPVYRWTFSDNFTSNLKSVTRTWPFEGPFSATLKASYSNGCEASITKNFEVLIQPKAAFDVKDICSGETATFANKSTGDKGNIQYFWDFGNGTYSNVAAPVRLYNPTTTTTYTVALVASYNGGCSDTASKTINVSESPVCDFTFKDLGLLSAKFTPSNSTYTSYEWFFGEGGGSTQVSPLYKYEYSGNFNVTMKATNAAGCSCEITKRVSATTGINSISNSAVSIYPNPNNGTFTISNTENHAMKVEIFNVLGAKVYSKTTAEGSMEVNLGDNAKGIYLVKVTSNGVTSTTKITVAN